MKYEIIEKNDNGMSMKVAFDFKGEKTCMKTWTFDIENGDGELKVKDSKIDFSGQGCKGHPKTISALIRNRPLDTIDTEVLRGTGCFQPLSCGMNLGSCIDEIRKIII
jgi:hypothetical protein